MPDRIPVESNTVMSNRIRIHPISELIRRALWPIALDNNKKRLKKCLRCMWHIHWFKSKNDLLLLPRLINPMGSDPKERILKRACPAIQCECYLWHIFQDTSHLVCEFFVPCRDLLHSWLLSRTISKLGTLEKITMKTSVTNILLFCQRYHLMGAVQMPLMVHRL